ncbi:unnamed protein product [Dibothriocephalus latus]|uniref:Uncharacterized protein n=1 Tax=Dibothriocephalus latus TaxID=60516 RepID=A0A3P6T0D9_DIBLA|nr:unnamed protein product [Dibothriocephalus latus]
MEASQPEGQPKNLEIGQNCSPPLSELVNDLTAALNLVQQIQNLEQCVLTHNTVSLGADQSQHVLNVTSQLAVERSTYGGKRNPDRLSENGSSKNFCLLKFCLRTHSTFDGTISEQVKGTIMGSPISGLIPDVVLKRLDSLVFQKHRPKFWARKRIYVLFERDQVLMFKERLNSVFQDILFTMQEEKNNQLAFFDILVCAILLPISFAQASVDEVAWVAIFSEHPSKIWYFGNFVFWFTAVRLNMLIKRPYATATTIFATNEDIKEGQLVVLFLLHRKFYVLEDAVETFLEHEHLIPFEEDVDPLPRPEFRSVVFEDQ